MAKRKSDARFLKSEKLMIGAATEAISSGGPLTITSLCQRAGIFTSTFYRHYRNLNELAETCNKNLLHGFSVLLNEMDKKRLSMEKLFKKWAWFIYQNREAFSLSILMDQTDLLLSMMRELRPVATVNWRSSPQKTTKIYLIYSYEVIGILMNWAEQEHFDIDKITDHAQELNYLTHTALQRLGGLASD